jgi:hypothetical protein
MLKRLWLDEGGAILSAELILIMVILVIGLVAGLQAVRVAVVDRLADVAGAIGAIDATYNVDGIAWASISSMPDTGITGSSGAWSYTSGAQVDAGADVLGPAALLLDAAAYSGDVIGSPNDVEAGS